MSILFVLIPLGLLLLGIALAAFLWAIGNGQYDDLESPAWRILLDDEKRPPAKTSNHNDIEESADEHGRD
ncbi:MAG: cbb3-type cytochrome oxidase assembly protein CcoS [Spiribacter sp.]|jgi:cbb3-type cytochrome oxidase maturation protein|nr:cbb3-type cytochrome oxidase assembly protein CcoS [Spiribacter sp.]MDR9489804.1 cbb3-type cytochrome oxidase assembly protein CcoS [Spiribacter sp.]